LLRNHTFSSLLARRPALFALKSEIPFIELIHFFYLQRARGQKIFICVQFFFQAHFTDRNNLVCHHGSSNDSAWIRKMKMARLKRKVKSSSHRLPVLEAAMPAILMAAVAAIVTIKITV